MKPWYAALDHAHDRERRVASRAAAKHRRAVARDEAALARLGILVDGEGVQELLGAPGILDAPRLYRAMTIDAYGECDDVYDDVFMRRRVDAAIPRCREPRQRACLADMSEPSRAGFAARPGLFGWGRLGERFRLREIRNGEDADDVAHRWYETWHSADPRLPDSLRIARPTPAEVKRHGRGHLTLPQLVAPDGSPASVDSTLADIERRLVLHESMTWVARPIGNAQWFKHGAVDHLTTTGRWKGSEPRFSNLPRATLGIRSTPSPTLATEYGAIRLSGNFIDAVKRPLDREIEGVDAAPPTDREAREWTDRMINGDVKSKGEK